jgi:di/tricarboxylate transporter
VTLLFAQAQNNGTLERIAHRAVRVCRGNAGMIPVMFFTLAAALATIGPGNISTAALLAPMAMQVAGRAGIPAFLMAIMVGNGANAGSLSPFAPTGIIVDNIMAKTGMGGVEWQTYLNNLAAHVLVAFGGYFAFGGWKLFGKTYTAPAGHEQAFEMRHWITAGAIAALVVSVVGWKVNVGMGAFTTAVALAVVGAADHKEAIRKMPWGVIVMVCGLTVLISLLEKTSGMDLFSALLAKLATPATVTGVVAFVTGIVSVYSSTSGVVLPAFLPTVPGLVERLGGGDPLAIASSMNVGSHLVDVSPLSTIGALCLAALPAGEDAQALFRRLLIWGFSMSVVGAVACYLLF